MLKCTKFDFGWGSTPDPARELSLQRSPRPLSWICGPLRGRGRGWAGEEEGKGRAGEGEGSGGEGKEGPQVTVEPGPLRALLRHCKAVKTTNAKHEQNWTV